MSHMPALDNPTLVDVEALEARVTVLEANGVGAPANLFEDDVLDLVDDWTYVGPMYVTLTGTSGTPVGDHTLTMTGTARLVGITGTGRQGLVSLQAGETTDGQCRVHTCAMGAFDNVDQANLNRLRHWSVLGFETLSTAGEEYITRAGLVGNPAFATPLPGYGCFFRYNRVATGVHKWEAVNRNLDTETAVILDGTTQGGIATVDAGTIIPYSFPNTGFMRLHVDMQVPTGLATDGGTVRYYVNGTLCATLTTNLPSHSLASSVEMLKVAGTTSRNLALDYTRLRYDYRSTRLP